MYTDEGAGRQPAAGRRRHGVATVPRVILTQADRDLLCSKLQQVMACAVAVEETITVAAYAGDTLPSAWSESRIDSIRECAQELLEAVRASPIAAD